MAIAKTLDDTSTKQFFVDMLTKDITLADCILDLVDNSLQQVIESAGFDVTDAISRNKQPNAPGRQEVVIAFDAKGFSIQDSCGGISLTRAQNEVFVFGNSGKELQHYGLAARGKRFLLGSLV